MHVNFSNEIEYNKYNTLPPPIGQFGTNANCTKKTVKKTITNFEINIFCKHQIFTQIFKMKIVPNFEITKKTASFSKIKRN